MDGLDARGGRTSAAPPQGGAVTPEQVSRAAELSRLELTPEEAQDAAAALDRLLRYMDVLSQMDLEGVEPMSRLFPVKNVLREDQAVPSMDRAELLAGAPASDGEAFLVPKAVE